MLSIGSLKSGQREQGSRSIICGVIYQRRESGLKADSIECPEKNYLEIVEEVRPVVIGMRSVPKGVLLEL